MKFIVDGKMFFCEDDTCAYNSTRLTEYVIDNCMQCLSLKSVDPDGGDYDER